MIKCEWLDEGQMISPEKKPEIEAHGENGDGTFIFKICLFLAVK
jgi:hypothetical protein